MTNCYITSNSMGGGAQGVPSQSVSIAYEQIEYRLLHAGHVEWCGYAGWSRNLQHWRRRSRPRHVRCD